MPDTLPNAERAFVDIAKLRNYSLNETHEKGKHKARVFRAALGFTVKDAEKLRQLLLAAVLVHEAKPGAPTLYGQRYVVDVPMPGPGGEVLVRSAWVIRNDEDFPRLTSCFVVR